MSIHWRLKVENSLPNIKITKLNDGKMRLEAQGVSLLEMTAAAMLLLDKVYDNLNEGGYQEMAEIVGSVLETVAALVQLANTNTKSN